MIKVVVLSMHVSEEYIIQALRAGAVGYLLKDADVSELESAIRRTASGEIYLSPSISSHIAEYMKRVYPRSDQEDQNTNPYQILTPRQREILQLIAEGHSTQEIAQILDLSVKTVETHRTQLMERLDIHDIANLVRYAIRMGLVSVEN
jgi:DNA-binding NarL/FixJ family response regulator